MGHVESRFKESVEAGDHSKVYELYYNKKVLRDSLDPTEKCYADGSSILHQTARHAMQPLYETFLDASNSNPLELTNNKQSCIHLICSNSSDDRIRLKMLSVTLQNHHLLQDTPSKVSQADKSGNTPLHYACEAGLMECVLVLLKARADPKVANEEGQFPVDLAATNGYTEIAQELEKQIVFAVPQDVPLIVDMDPVVVAAEGDGGTGGMGLKDQQLQSMKDTLIIETSELLGVSLFVAETLLRNNGWSKQELLDSWMVSPHATCEKAGVDLPSRLSVDNIDDHVNEGAGLCVGKGRSLGECPICYTDTVSDVQTPCGHAFCVQCWQQYLHDKISSGQVGGISCPEYGCYKLIPIHIIEKLVTREMAAKYLQYDLKSFVDTNPNMRWCPHPGCGQAVSRATPTIDPASPPPTQEQPTCVFVHCGNDHYFCWLCGEIGHAPCTCKEWRDWLNKIKELSVKLGGLSAAEVSDAASSQWVIANSKPCPSCSVPIEKTSGCNHIKCWKCRHDFCWMCLDKWNKHNSSTGGYFECNRYKLIEKVQEMLDQNQKSEDYELINHFKHYYDRYTNHLHSLQLESKYLYSADAKMAELQQLTSGVGGAGVQFVKDAVRHLVEARHTLIASYGYGYFIMVRRVKEWFERQQGDFEEQVEALAEVVARPHLRKSKHEIIQLTNTVRDKREEFIVQVERGIQPPTPTLDSLFKRTILNDAREKERADEERQIRQAVMESTRHFQTEAQLNSDTELAILLSMQGEGREKPHCQQVQVQQETGYHGYDGLANGSPAYHLPTLPEALPFVHPSGSQNSTESPLNIDLDRWRQSLLAGPVDWSSSSPSTTPSPDHSHCVTPPPSSINRPSNKEEEDYQMALALSLSVSNGGPGGSNDLNTTAVRNTSNSQQLLNVLFSNTSRHARDV